VVLEYHEIHGMLNGIAAARAAAAPESRVMPKLDAGMPVLRSSFAGQTFNEAGWEYRRATYDEYAGPRLLANIRASQSFIPREFWGAYLSSAAEMLPLYERETEAIRSHDTEGARAANIERANVMAKVMLDELRRRGVLGNAAVLAV
jgi:hypothetical protein